MRKGQPVHFVPGWDCHGLPIELRVYQQNSSLINADPNEIRKSGEYFFAGRQNNKPSINSFKKNLNFRQLYRKLYFYNLSPIMVMIEKILHNYLG